MSDHVQPGWTVRNIFHYLISGDSLLGDILSGDSGGNSEVKFRHSSQQDEASSWTKRRPLSG